MRKGINAYFFISIWVIFLVNGIGSVNGQVLPTYRYGTADGLPTDIVKHAVTDNLGYLWLGTDEGLIRHNGVSTKDFSKYLPSHYVKQVSITQDGKLYVVTDMGIVSIESSIDTAIVKPFIKGDGSLSDSTVQWPKCLYEDMKGYLWIGEANVVRATRDGQMKRYLFEPPYNRGSFTRGFSFAEDQWGTLWAFSHAGYLFWFDEQKSNFNLASNSLKINGIDAVLQRNGDTFWVGGGNEVASIQVNEQHEIVQARIIFSGLGSISTLARKDDGQVFVGGYIGGLYTGIELPNGQLQLKRLEGVGSDVQMLSVDKRQDVWVATMTGAYLLKNAYFGVVAEANGYINSITQDEEGAIIFSNGGNISKAVNQAGIYVQQSEWRNTPMRTYKGNENFGFMAVAAHAKDLWIGTDYGWLLKYDGQSVQRLEATKVAQSAFFIMTDKQGNAWSCHDQYNGVLRTNTSGQSLPYDLQARIVVARENAAGDIYLGGLAADKYLYRYNASSNTFDNISLPAADGSKLSINDLAFGRADTVWLGASDGLYAWTPKGVTKATWYQQEAWGGVHALATDKQGTVWVGCKPGLVAYNGQEVQIFNEESGLAANFINYRGIYPSKDRGIFVATSKGVSYVAHAGIATTLTPTPFISEIALNGVVVKSLAEAITSNAHLRLSLTTLAYPVKLVEYQYKIDNGQWEYTEKPEISLYQLEPGNYQLQIRARQQGGYQWSEAVQLSFQVAMPWHRQWWAYMSFVVMAGLGVWGIVKANTYRLQKEKERLAKIIRDRTAEIQAKNKELELKAGEIKLQNVALQSQKEEIQAQNEELLQLTEETSSQRDKIERQHQDLERAYDDIKNVSLIGNEIAGTLTIQRLIETVYSHVNRLMDAEIFIIGVLEPDNQHLRISWINQHTMEIAENFDDLSDLQKLTSYCLRQQQPILIADFGLEALQYLPLPPEEVRHASHLYVPIFYQSKPLGVISVQHTKSHTFQTRHLTILQALGAYVATAIDNAGAYEIIKNKNELITDSIRYAQRIQQAILPAATAMSATFSEHFVLYKPKDIVSGDFYWMAQVQEAIYLAVVDCTGHGVPGAFMSMIGSRILNEVVFEKGIGHLPDILAMVDQRVKDALRQGESTGKESITDGMDLAICRIAHTPAGYDVRFAAAKSALFLAKGNESVQRIKGNNRSIGGLDMGAKEPYTEHKFLLQNGDAFWMATDGFIDQANEERKKFGTPQFMELLEAGRSSPMSAINQTLVEALASFQKNTPQRDDITVVGVRL